MGTSILGIFANCHDSAAALARDGDIVAAVPVWLKGRLSLLDVANVDGAY